MRKEKTMGESAFVSVIMPVYNPGNYLNTAIMGILNQSYGNYELICIDDACTDGSTQVLMQYQKQDERIRLVHHSENMGAAYARNEGIESARGKYLFFVDADDVFERDLLKHMVQAAEPKPVDMVFINYDVFEDEKTCNSDIRGKYYYFGEFFSKYNEMGKWPKGLLRSIPLAPYSRLYSTDFVKRNKLWFQDLKSSNDVYFGIMATSLSQRIAFLEEQINLVHVRIHGGRYRISNKRNPYDNFRAYLYLVEEMERRQLPDEDVEIVRERFLDNTLGELRGCTLEQRKEYYQFVSVVGLEEMGILKNGRIIDLDPIYQRIAIYFLDKPLESSWIKDFSLFGGILEKWKAKIECLFQQIAREGKKCGIWGAGKDGRRMAAFCAQNHCECIGFTDKDRTKWGESLFGYRIYAPEEIFELVDTVIILNQRYFNDIYDQIKAVHKKMEMVSLDMYLQYEQDLYSSTINC